MWSEKHWQYCEFKLILKDGNTQSYGSFSKNLLTEHKHHFVSSQLEGTDDDRHAQADAVLSINWGEVMKLQATRPSVRCSIGGEDISRINPRL